MNGAGLAVLIAAAFLALLIFVLCFPLCFDVRYFDDKLEIDLKFLFIKKRLVPAKSKKAAEKNAYSKNVMKKKTPGQKEPFFDLAERFFSLVASGGSLLKLAVSFHNAKFELNAAVGGEDAASAAVKTGKFSAYFHSAAAILANYLTIKKRVITVCPDYSRKDTEICFKGRFWSYPIRYLFNIHKILPLLLKIADAVNPQNTNSNKGEKKQ